MDDVAISWGGFGCGPSAGRSRARGDFTSYGVSLEQTCFFWGNEGYFGGRSVDA